VAIILISFVAESAFNEGQCDPSQLTVGFTAKGPWLD
jgi:hypothetical protein